MGGIAFGLRHECQTSVLDAAWLTQRIKQGRTSPQPLIAFHSIRERMISSSSSVAAYRDFAIAALNQTNVHTTPSSFIPHHSSVSLHQTTHDAPPSLPHEIHPQAKPTITALLIHAQQHLDRNPDRARISARGAGGRVCAPAARDQERGQGEES